MKRIFSKKWIGWAIVIVLIITIKIISINPVWVERYYTNGVYPIIAVVLRYMFGWLPFSIGDIAYSLAIVFVIFKIVGTIKRIKNKNFSKQYAKSFIRKGVFVALVLYVVFYGLWGLNYSRLGIASQLGLKAKEYTTRDIDTLVGLLHSRLNNNAVLLTNSMRDSFKTKRDVFFNASLLYKIAATKYPFLAYKAYSVKPSLFSYFGNYMGFQGYYNPFTGEGQVNTTIPKSVEPFVAAHEIAHQLGYAKESEANFVGFLACRLHPSINFKYSVYFDMYHYAIRELASVDTVKAKQYDSTLHKQVKKDMDEYIAFYKKYRNPIEPYIYKFYGYFLKANNQPKGRASYNEVVSWLIAYYKKYGHSVI
ncbi:DUF3810 domain-containing protein [Niabella ginsengisoli]|uniref:DUF3810 domain-containing protein n=1 Tax=Niabella ginsengisoli TaxID=522298 RepID=A0ABS9SMD2_9BACT|nr:DUF3810 domain-containing protein [Niabella ginsengisoli]MCH5599314.1 DUF3810 domain-containing protein [Niabella ginsengisoli]